MNIAIIGYGKMGREIARISELRGHTIGLIIDVTNAGDLNQENLRDIDVAIEFSTPDSAFQNISVCIRENVPVVSGTTGWLDKLDQAIKLCNETNGGLFYASNFSIGVNVLFAMNTRLAEIMQNFQEYDVSIEEIHHVHKLDAPSGTAISLANQITEKISSKNSWTRKEGEPKNIYINSKREGEVSGYHCVTYESEIDTISISHNAKSRVGFATGAVLAAEYMQGKSGIHSMQEMLNL
ncbi:MAG: 4-hydroxy-tetrahydrodipicolinate reductase [Bacteroidales bacterium]